MRVYLVFYYDEFCGVFSTRENAEEYLARFSEYDQLGMRIDEEHLDEF